MKRIASGPYRGFPERYRPVFERYPELWKQLEELSLRGINLLEDDAYGTPPEPGLARELLAEHASGRLSRAALQQAREELELERLKWELALRCLESSPRRGPAALMIRSGQVADRADAEHALEVLEQAIELLNQPPEYTPATLDGRLAETLADLRSLAACREGRERLRRAESRLREALLMVLELLPQPVSLDQLAALVAPLMPEASQLPAALRNLLERGELLAVAVDGRHYLPAWSVIDGVKLRLIVSTEELSEQVLALEHHLPEFLLMPGRDSFSLHDERGRAIDEAVFELGSLGHVVQLAGWLRRQRLAAGDEVVLTVASYRERRFRLRAEPAAERDEQAIARVSGAFTRELLRQLELSPEHSLYLHQALPRVWARLRDVRRVAPESLKLLVLGEPRLELIEDSILSLSRTSSPRR